MKPKMRYVVLTVLALVAVTGVLILSTTSRIDRRETDANEQQKADLPKLSPVSTISLGASFEASRKEGTKLEQDNAALRQQLHQLQEQGRQGDQHAQTNSTKKAKTQTQTQTQRTQSSQSCS